MYRATTPVHSFIFTTDPEDFEKIIITYAYGKDDRVVLEKTKDDLSFSQETKDDGTTAYVASFQLTQEETNLFRLFYGDLVHVQVRAKDSDGNVFASDTKLIYVKDVLNDEVL